jgi:acyl-CoA thioesterase-1
MQLFRPLLLLLVFLCPLSLFASPSTAKILVLGDSLSAGYGIALEEGWVSLLQERIKKHQFAYEVVNASVSGETSGGGLARLPALLAEHQPMIVILELGGNDGLRGHPINVMRQNLEKIIAASQAANAQVLLLGMHIPPNYGARYARTFHQAYIDLAKKYQLSFVPFFLDQVANNAALMQSDGIHPTAEAQGTMLDHVWPTLEPLLK